jgi:uncharacterized membrane protein YhaH (DUF805 family)
MFRSRAHDSAIQPVVMHLETHSPVTLAETAPAAPNFFSLSDRVGRVRYITYILGALTSCGLLLILIYIAAYLLPAGLGKLVSATSYIMIKSVIFPLIVFVMSIRRLHDLDLSGWWSLLALIPLVPIALVLIPGKKEANRFGPVPAPNPTSLKLAAIVLPCALVGLYYYMLEINPKARIVEAPAAGAKPALRSYDAK